MTSPGGHAGDVGDRRPGIRSRIAKSLPRRAWRAILLSFLLAMLNACAELKPYLYGPTGEPPKGAWDRHQARVAGLHHWNFNGRLALSRGQEGWSARLNWLQQGARFRLRLQGPLGQGSYELSGVPGELLITTAEGKQYRAGNAEQLMRQRLGWTVPVTGLGYWVRGIPQPGQRYRSIGLDAQGRMTDLDQSGWRVSILRYIKAGEYSLPGKVFMVNGDLKIRLVIDDWREVSP